MMTTCLTCGELTEQAYCQDHRPAEAPKTKTAAQRGYDYRWQKLSKRARRIQKDRPKIKSPKVETGRNGFGKGSKWIWRLEETSPIDSTENTIDSIHSRAQESTESSESMRQQPESMTKASCYEHGTNYKIPTCSTCLELAKETA